MRRSTILAAVMASGCVAPATSSPAVVSQYVMGQTGLEFESCRVEYGWWTQRLIDECGPATVWMPSADDGGFICAVFASKAQAFIGEQSAPYVVVCLEPATREPPQNPAPPLKKKLPLRVANGHRYRVASVYGMAAPPPEPAQPTQAPPKPAETTPEG